MKRIHLAVVCVIGLGLTAAYAQAPSIPKPGPEHEKLGYFVGKWSTEGNIKESPFGPAGKMTTNDTCEWFEGNFAVVCNSKGKGPMGPMKSLGIIGYEPMEKVYTYYGVDNSGQAMISVPRGTLEEKTWRYTDESKMGEITAKTRYTMTELSKDAYTFKWEIEGEGGTWTTVMEGKATRN
jgi:hypothetical protein